MAVGLVLPVRGGPATRSESQILEREIVVIIRARLRADHHPGDESHKDTGEHGSFHNTQPPWLSPLARPRDVLVGGILLAKLHFARLPRIHGGVQLPQKAPAPEYNS